MDAEPLQSFHSFYSFSFFIQKYRHFFSGLIFLGDGQHNLINLTGSFSEMKASFITAPS